MNKFILPSAMLLAGTTIGAGIFGIPYSTAQVGYAVGVIWLIAIILLTLAMNFAYGYVVLHTPGDKPRQLISHSEYYFGIPGRWMGLFVMVFGNWSAILAYMIGIGEFVGLIFNAPEYKMVFSLIVFALVSVALFAKLQLVAFLEQWLTIAKVGVICIIIAVGWSQLQSSNLLVEQPNVTFAKFLLPYGVFMSAMSGSAIIPEMRELFGKAIKSRPFYLSILIGTLLPGIVYLLFQVVVVGISGIQTSQEAIQGLTPYLNSSIILIGAIFGAIAMVGPFITLAYVLRDSLKDDLSVDPKLSIVVTMLPPLILYLAGLQSFIAALEFLGTWLGTASVLLIAGLFYKSTTNRMVS